MSQSVKTAKEMQESMMTCLREWLENPGNVERLVFEYTQGMHPNTGQPLRLFTVKGEAIFQKNVMPAPAPTIVAPGNGTLPPPPGSRRGPPIL